ncbi:MAG: phosphoglycerate kinase [Archaeoglobaceae archaeon]|nr:phosphoglycerate kinase [Archaeoglobaceae archaeon]MCX8152748.1 phosphoglycerate kinase [Archaeoglobaceae archaeon]MDW8013455.1 phosphoglycerate kinase [Archaeoglobaceae archaeon]
MINDIPTLDDVRVDNKSIVMRIDINAPIVDSKILDFTRFESHIPTIKELEDAKLVLLAHQSRPGRKDFTTLEEHAKVLSKLLGKEVEYLDEIFSSRVQEKIKNMKNGEIILLENVRFYSEEQLERTPEEHAESHLVKKLKKYFDIFVNDAFSSSHRSHASIVGFVPVLPSVVGRLVEKEVAALNVALKSDGRKLFILGGAKMKDPVKVMKNVLENGIAEKVALTGVLANYFLKLKGFDIGKENEKVVEENKEGLKDEEMKKLFEKYREKIVLPVDLGVEKEGKRIDVTLEKFKGEVIKDIGIETAKLYAELAKEYDVVVVKGVAGVFEDQKFAIGTHEILKGVTKSKFSIVGGGHAASAAELFGLSNKIGYISTAGGACISYLSGEKLPAIEAIKDYWKKKWNVVLRNNSARS